MLRFRSTFFSGVCVALSASIATIATTSKAQSCCAGSTALTPGRLALHEDALVAASFRAATLIGSHDASRQYSPSPNQTSERDFEQDVIGTLRIVPRGQATVLVPFNETFRRFPTASEGGGGLGDVTLSARYDFVAAGASQTIPGIAMLAGVTLPTGTPPERATRPLATDATGIGAFQGALGAAVEQTFGHLLLNLSVFASKRLPRTASSVHTTLGTQVTTFGAIGYSFDNDAAIALTASYAVEGNAVVDGEEVSSSGRAITTVAAAAAWPLSDHYRLQGSVVMNPPLSQLGKNQPSSLGMTLTLVRSWS
ncbi:MAG: hypothetical protein NVSMB1_08470 [Polyangiales bacterium]